MIYLRLWTGLRRALVASGAATVLASVAFAQDQAPSAGTAPGASPDANAAAPTAPSDLLPLPPGADQLPGTPVGGAPPPSGGVLPPSAGLVSPQSPDRPAPFDPSAAPGAQPPIGTLPPGADLSRGAAPAGPGGYSSALTPPPGVPADPPEGLIYSPNPSLFKLGPKDSYAVLRTSYGKMTVKLYANYAPQTVRNFIDLAKGEREFADVRTGKRLKKPFYDGLIFHRVIRGFIAQTGCPFGNGRGGPGFEIPDEIHPALRHSRAGVVSMANELDDQGEPRKNGAGSQFFITLGPRREFDGKYSIFGQVVSGLDVLDKIGNAKTGPTDRPVRRIVLHSIEVVEKK